MSSISESVWIGEATWGQLSPWWRRVVAEVIDGTLIAFIANMLLAIMGVHTWWSGHQGYVLGTELLAQEVTLVFAALLYYPVLMVRTNGRTVGKILLGIRVVRTSHAPMNVACTVWREVGLKIIVLGLARDVPLAGLLVNQIIFWADGLWPLWDHENRALHDMLARTRVVRV
jgi:uncharacterized RDD family membrane protein YckC